MRKKEILAYALDSIIPNMIFGNIRRIFANELIILAYHRVQNISSYEKYPYDSGLISASTKQFDYQIAYLKKYYNPISEQQLISHLYNKTALPANAVLITFDDGFDDNYHHAYPILKRYDVPATIFISTSYIGGEEPIWFDWLASLCISAAVKSIDIPVLNISYSIAEFSNRSNIFNDLIIKIREINNDIRIQLLQQLKKDYSQYMSHIDTAKSRFMSWNQITEMSNNNITIGSHTVTHPILSRQTADEVRYEIIESKRVIESYIQKSVLSFSYPTGQPASFTENTVNEIKSAGYKLAHTYIHGVNILPVNNIYKLERLHIEKHVNNSYFKSMLTLPNVFRD